MTDIAIRVENLSKMSHIGRAQQRHDTLCDVPPRSPAASLDRLRRNSHHASRITHHEDTIWALKGVSE